MYLRLVEESDDTGVARKTLTCWKPAPGCCRYCMYSVTKLVLNSACQGSSQRGGCKWSSVNELQPRSLAAALPLNAAEPLSTLSERLLCMLVPEPCLERCQLHTRDMYLQITQQDKMLTGSRPRPSPGSLVLDGLLHSNLWCGQSTSSFCQASLPRCASTQSQLVWASGICCCRPNCLELTVWSDAVSDVCLKLGCFQSTSTYSASEVSHFMRYINSRLTYLLTYLTQDQILIPHDQRPDPVTNKARTKDDQEPRSRTTKPLPDSCLMSFNIKKDITKDLASRTRSGPMPPGLKVRIKHCKCVLRDNQVPTPWTTCRKTYKSVVLWRQREVWRYNTDWQHVWWQIHMI